MLSTLIFTLIYLVALANSDGALVTSWSNSYIKNKLRNTKELLDKSYSMTHMLNKNIGIATDENLNKMIDKESEKKFGHKNVDEVTLNFNNDTTILVKFLRKLKKLLDYKININTEKSWLSLRKLYLERGNIEFVSFRMTEGITCSTVSLINIPADLKRLSFWNLVDITVKGLDIPENHIFFKNEKAYLLSGAIALNGLIIFHEISINNVSALYLMDKKVERLLISEMDQSFSSELRIFKNFIKNLQVNEICDLAFKYWLPNHDRSVSLRTDSNNINLNSCSISVINESVISVNGTYQINEINVNKVNGVNIKNVISSTFFLKEIQVIRGGLISVTPMRAMELLVEKINNVSSSRLLNKVKNKSAHEIAIDRLEVHHLLVDKINEVAVSDAARTLGENVIKGKVRISSLLIRNEVKVKENVSVALNNSMQIYEETLIAGNVHVKNAELDSENGVTVRFKLLSAAGNTLGNNRNDLYDTRQALEQSWRKSEEQTISQNVRVEKGASVNELECQYLNGLKEEEFVYSACRSLRLENVSFNRIYSTEQLLSNNDNRSETSFRAAGAFIKTLKRFSSEFIAFDRLIRIARFSVDRLVLDYYNGIPVVRICSESFLNPLSCPEFHFHTFRATEQMHVRQLNVAWLNERGAISTFGNAMRSDERIKVDKLAGEKGKHEVNAISSKNVKIKELCRKNVEDGLLKQEILTMNKGEEIVLTIAERLQVESTFRIIDRRLNEQEIEYYISSMKRDFRMDNLIEIKRIKRLERVDVLKDLNARRVLSERLRDVFAAALSVSSHQLVSSLNGSNFKIDYLSSEKLNNIKASSLMYRTDTPPSISATKYFSSLVVKGHIKAKRLNDEPAATIKIAEALKISGAMLDNQFVYIFGFVLWEVASYLSSVRSESVKELFSYAVLKSIDQSLDCSLLVEQATAVDVLEIGSKKSTLVLNKILESLSECLLDRGDGSTASTASAVTGKKEFRKKVEARRAKVLKNIRISSINCVHFDKLALRILRKSAMSNKTMIYLATLSFLYSVEIEKFRTPSSVTESLNGITDITDRKIMPSRLTFKRLIIKRNVSLHDLDNLVFNNKFVTNIVNIAEPYVFADVHFNRSIAVLTCSSVGLLNGIKASHFVLGFINKESATRSLIKGKKIFSPILCVDKNLDVPSVTSNKNDIFVNVYDTTELTEIFGNLEIEENVESLSDIAGLELRDEISIIERSRKVLLNKANAVNQLAMTGASNNAFALMSKRVKRGRFFYLDRMTNFNLYRYRVEAVTSKTIDYSSTRLDLYISESGTFCGLPIDCPCRAYLVLEISSSGNYRVIESRRSNILLDFHEPAALVGLRLFSEGAVQSGKLFNCSKREAAATTIFWTKLNAYGEAKAEKLALRIEGFVSHAQVFLINNAKQGNKLYMILAKFYDNTLRSYATDSLVYEFDLESKMVNIRQTIATDGAKRVHVFQIAKAGVYALIGCVKGKAESPLLRFDPITRQLIRTFATGGSKHIASLSKENRNFVILSNPDIEALQIYIYNAAFDNFYYYQSLYFQSRVSSLNVFYSEDFGQDSAYFTVTTQNGLFNIYQYTFSGKFQMKMSYRIGDCQVLSSFRIGNQNYFFATHGLNNTIFKLVQDNNQQ